MKERAETCEIPPSVWPLHLARWRGLFGQWGLSGPGPLLGWQLWRCLRSAGSLQGEEHVTLSLQACHQSQPFAPVGSGDVGGEESGQIKTKGKMWSDPPSGRRQHGPVHRSADTRGCGGGAGGGKGDARLHQSWRIVGLMVSFYLIIWYIMALHCVIVFFFFFSCK